MYINEDHYQPPRFTALPIRQKFSFQSPFMSYLQKNWSPSIYAKLIKSCKYFFYVKKAVQVRNFDFTDDSNANTYLYIRTDKFQKLYKSFVYQF